MDQLLDVIASTAMSTNPLEKSHDEILIDFLIENPCLWDKSDHDFRNRNLKDSKWKEVASKMNMAAHEAIRRYKTLCERFRREMIKQSSIPNFVSTWSLFPKFAALKDAQTSDDRKFRVKAEDLSEHEIIDFAALAEAATNTTHNRKRKNNNNSQKEFNESRNEHNNGTDESITNGCSFSKIPRFFDIQSIDDDNDTTQSINVEPSYIGGSTDLSTDSIAAFCQFIEATLKRMSTDRSDEIIEDISHLLFRKKREFKEMDANNDSMASPSSS